MHDNDITGAIGMRVGILLAGLAVGGPTRMPDTRSALGIGNQRGFFQFCHFAYGADRNQITVLQYSQAGRVVSAVFQFFQTVNNIRYAVIITYIADNSAHNTLL